MYTELKIEEFDIFYQMLLTHFPKKEIKEYEYLKEKCKEGTNRVLTYREENEIIGILCYMDIGEYAFIEYLAILDTHQGKRLGEQLLNYFKGYCGKKIVLEVELPENSISERRIRFYQKQGLILNPYPYVVPPNHSLTQDLTFLLMTYPEAMSEVEFEKMYPIILKSIYEIA